MRNVFLAIGDISGEAVTWNLFVPGKISSKGSHARVLEV